MKYSAIRAKCAQGKYACGGRAKYASGGRVKGGGKTVVNINVSPSGVPSGSAMAAPAPAPMPSGGPPVPPAAAQMAMRAMGAGGPPPGQFARGGRVKGGAGGGIGRLDKIKVKPKKGAKAL